MRKWLMVWVSFFFAFISCGNETAVSEKKAELVTTDTSISSGELKNDTYTQFIIDKSGSIVDSLPDGVFSYDRLKTNLPQEFPSGIAATQQILSDSIQQICQLKCEFCEEIAETKDSMYCAKEGGIVQEFKDTKGESFFTTKNRRNYYFFLTQLDSHYQFITDMSYGLLIFLRLKTNRFNLVYKVKNGTESHVNLCKYREIQWEKPIPVHILENNKHYTPQLKSWKEFWECGQKADYAPNLPYLKFIPAQGLIGNYKIPFEEEYQRMMNDAQFAFSYICMDEQEDTLFREVKPKRIEMQLVTTNGTIRKGFGLDFNNDKYADAFWCNLIDFSPIVMVNRYTLLYLKIDNKWKPVYSVYYSDNCNYLEPELQN